MVVLWLSDDDAVVVDGAGDMEGHGACSLNAWSHYSSAVSRLLDWSLARSPATIRGWGFVWKMRCRGRGRESRQAREGCKW